MVIIDERVKRIAKDPNAWIGVDLDGTLADYVTWTNWNAFGEPIAPMVERVRAWRATGISVRIVTARVGLPLFVGRGKTFISGHLTNTCVNSGERFSDRMMVDAIQAYTLKHVGERLPVQCYKDLHMIELWDDRAVQVVPNTGRTLAEEHAAELSALRGRAFGDVDGRD